jgi:hypothetical protein
MIPYTKEHIYFVLRNENGIMFLRTESQSTASTFGMNLHLKIEQVHFDQTSHVFLLLLLELLPKCRIIIIFYQERRPRIKKSRAGISCSDPNNW